jgi:exopolysaccharide biosynthesis polyprenyl glycosylphosphotransferase
MTVTAAPLRPDRIRARLPLKPVTTRRGPAWARRYAVDLVLYDVVAASVAATAAIYLRFRFETEPLHVLSFGVPYELVSAALVLMWIVVMALSGTYSMATIGAGSDEYERVVNGGIRAVAGVAVIAFAFDLPLARAFVAIMLPLALLFTLVGRRLARRWLHARRAMGECQRSVLAVGSRDVIEEIAEHLDRAAHAGYRVVAACCDDPRPVMVGARSIPVVGTVSGVSAALDTAAPDVIAVAGDATGPSARSLALLVEGTGIDLVVAPALAEIAGSRIVDRPVAGLPLLHVQVPVLSGVRRVTKEACDRIIGTVLLIATLPLTIVIAACIRATSAGPVLFRQQRVGRDGEMFSMLKFRTMVADAELRLVALENRNEHDGVLFKMRDDPRRTRIGQRLRRWSLDELPQLWNVVRGDMSLVGPRPPLAAEVAQYDGHTRRRLMVKPGMTGLWQVSGRSELSWADSVRLDVYYVENWSLVLDVVILARTVAAVVRARGAY